MRPIHAASFSALLAMTGCAGGPATETACALDSDPALECDGGLVGYSCDGTARPDDQGASIDGVPEGLVCTSEGPVAAGNGFCCTPSTTPCVYDPILPCAPATYGYQCLGADRPEAFDPLLFCGEGLQEGNLIDYCCGPQPPAHGCQQANGATCPKTLVPWTCTDQTLPSEAELGSNQSRADFSLLVCDIPTVVQGNTTTTNYCCFTPTSVPNGASCLFDTTVPGCPSGSFGFACTGVDTPDEDYPGITCSGGSTPGTSPQGYGASLYCCQYQ